MKQIFVQIAQKVVLWLNFLLVFHCSLWHRWFDMLWVWELSSEGLAASVTLHGQRPDCWEYRRLPVEQISIIASVSEETSAESLFSVNGESDAVCSPWGVCVQQCRVKNEISTGLQLQRSLRDSPASVGEMGLCAAVYPLGSYFTLTVTFCAWLEGMLRKSGKCFQLLEWRVSCSDAKGVL